MRKRPEPSGSATRFSGDTKPSAICLSSTDGCESAAEAGSGRLAVNKPSNTAGKVKKHFIEAGSLWSRPDISTTERERDAIDLRAGCSDPPRIPTPAAGTRPTLDL